MSPFVVDGFVNQVVHAHRTIAPMNRADPIIRRHEGISQRLDELSERGLHLLFGDTPTLDQQAATPCSATWARPPAA